MDQAGRPEMPKLAVLMCTFTSAVPSGARWQFCADSFIYEKFSSVKSVDDIHVGSDAQPALWLFPR